VNHPEQHRTRNLVILSTVVTLVIVLHLISILNGG
jgi:hypothetical protein